MNESHPCPQCGEYLDVPAAMLGQPVRCGNCSRIFTPRESLSAVEFDAPIVQRRRRRDYPAAESRSSTRRVLLIIFGVLGLVGFVCCGGLVYFVYVAMNPTWKPYDSPTGEFSGKFPGDPVAGTCLTGRGKEPATEISAHRKLFQENYFVYFIPLTDPADKRKTSDTLLNEFADGLLTQNPASTEVRPRVKRTHGGHEAMDVCLELLDERHLQARIVLTDKYAYVVGVTHQHQPDEAYWVNEFIDAFQPNAVNPAAPGNGKNPFRKK
jgi:hypothetical protein